MPADRLEHVERADQVDAEIVARLADGRRDRGLRGEMQHQVEAAFADDAGQGSLIGDVGAHERAGVTPAEPGEVRFRTRPREVVQQRDAMAERREAHGGVRADETAAAGHEDVHAGVVPIKSPR